SVFTRTPRFAQSSASALVSISTPPFDAQYGTERGNPPCPATELTLITEPPAPIAPPRCLQHRNTPVRLISMMCRQSSSDTRSMVRKIGLTPALFTSTSIQIGSAHV